MPDTAMSIAAVNQSPGVPIVPEQWGEIPYFLRKSRQNAGIDLNLKCRDALPAPLPARIAELSFFSIREIFLRYTGDFFAADGGGTALQPFLTGEAFGFVRFCLAWQIAEGLSPTRRRVPPHRTAQFICAVSIE